jgi:hypothetical protein
MRFAAVHHWRKHPMKDTNTGDQSGGLFRRDGSSTPPWHNGHNMGEESSKEIAEPTDDKNPVDAHEPAANRVSQAPENTANEK